MMGRLRRSWLALVAAALAGVAVAGDALAASPPQISVQASATEVEVGEPFTVQLKAMVEQGDPQPGRAEIAPPRDFEVLGQTESTQTFMQMSGAGTSVQVGRIVSWQLVAQKAGRYTIPAPTVEWNGRRIAGTAVTIQVVPATGQKRRQQQSGNPFLMPGGPGLGFPFPFRGSQQDDDVASEPRVAPDLALPSAPDPSIFVHTRIDRKSAVVGQQITLSVYVYRRIRPPQILSNHDAPLSDFLRVQLAKNPGTDRPVYTTVAGTRYVAELVDQMAVFPLHAGELHTGQVRFTFAGGSLRTPTERASEDYVIHVTEPPRAGRPVGYTVGDVGQFTLSASVAPRHIDEGGEVAVSLRLAGTGNLPQSLRIPERTGLEWLEPERKESIEPQGGVVGGWRTFGYVVRVKESGKVDLGAVTLPFWDPAAGRYQEVKAVVGTVVVNPTLPALDPATRKPIEQAAPDPFTAMPSPRAALGAYAQPRPWLLDGRSLWFVIAAPPLFVGTFSAGVGAARRARSRRATTKGSPATLAQEALAEARKAEALGDPGALAAALIRAIHFAVEGATGLRARGVLLADLPGELEQHGLSPELGEAIAGALASCEAVRFDPSAEARVRQDLAARVREVVAELARRKAA